PPIESAKQEHKPALRSVHEQGEMMADLTAPADRYQIAGRIERLPFSLWHLKMGAIVSTGWFFDGFDALAIAYVLPVLVPLWHLSFPQFGQLIAAGYIGQLIGSIV